MCRMSFLFDTLYCLDWVCPSVCSLELRTTLPQSLIAEITGMSHQVQFPFILLIT
ncbi:hypothetical protein ACRRTK_012359 [Alexandromys fortis]